MNRILGPSDFSVLAGLEVLLLKLMLNKKNTSQMCRWEGFVFKQSIVLQNYLALYFYAVGFNLTVQLCVWFIFNFLCCVFIIVQMFELSQFS